MPSPPSSSTDSQTDIHSLPFPSPPPQLSPQLSQTSLIHDSPFEYVTLSPEFGLDPPHILGGGFAVPVYDYHTPILWPDYPATPEINSGTSPLSAWPDMLTPCVCGCDGSPCIPQQKHRRPIGDTLEEHRVGELITFNVHGKCGMPLRDAFCGAYSGLSGRDDPMFVGSRTSISIRLQFPNCPQWAQQMRTKDWRRKPSPITKAKLATEIAKKVDRFLKDMERGPRNSWSTSPSPGVLTIDKIALVALEHVSMASWQPHLRQI